MLRKQPNPSAAERVVEEPAAEETVDTAEPAEGEEGDDRSSMRYRKQRRGGKGVRDIRTSERNGPVVSVKAVRDTDDVMLITFLGMVNRTSASEIRITGRNAQGVRLMNVDEGDRVVSLASGREEAGASKRRRRKPLRRLDRRSRLGGLERRAAKPHAARAVLLSRHLQIREISQASYGIPDKNWLRFQIWSPDQFAGRGIVAYTTRAATLDSVSGSRHECAGVLPKMRSFVQDQARRTVSGRALLLPGLPGDIQGRRSPAGGCGAIRN